MSDPYGVHIKALIQACKELGVEYNFESSSKAFIRVGPKENKHYFIVTETPFNSSMVSRICLDKGYTYDLLHDVIRMPKTMIHLDPFSMPPYDQYAQLKTYEAIAGDIIKNFELPMIIKQNKGALGINVFKVEKKDDVLSTVKEVLNHQSENYDYALLAQDYVKPKTEYRVTVLNKEIILLYEKNTDNATFTGNLSPLHWEGARAIIVEDEDFKSRVKTFINPIFDKLDLEYGGLDLIIDKNDDLWLVEINSHPMYSYLARDNGIEVVVEVFKKMIEYLLSK